MADAGVIVRRLASIENFGRYGCAVHRQNGTLTEGVVRLDGALGINGQPGCGVPIRLFERTFSDRPYQPAG